MNTANLFPVASSLVAPLPLDTPPQPLPLTQNTPALGVDPLLAGAMPMSTPLPGALLLPAEGLSSSNSLAVSRFATAPAVDPLTGII
jgi:hypothetical protein